MDKVDELFEASWKTLPFYKDYSEAEKTLAALFFRRGHRAGKEKVSE